MAGLPDLPSRFLSPPEWQEHFFEGAYEGRVRYGYAPCETAKAHIVILPGLSEFIEKYFETIHDLLTQNYAVWVIEWQGHGKSHRHLQEHPQRRSSTGFRNDVYDLTILIRDVIRRRHKKIPLYMLAHSMGGNIGLRYLHEHSEIFCAAALSAPMIEIKALEHIPHIIRKVILRAANKFWPQRYVPDGKDFLPDFDKIHANLFSSDPLRNQLFHIWSMHDPSLQVGNATWRWLYYADRSCRIVKDKEFLKRLDTPIVMGIAKKDHLISNSEIYRAGKLIPNSKTISFPTARHELLMERDEIRNAFLIDIYAFFANHT